MGVYLKDPGTETMAAEKLKINSKVKRLNGGSGCLGVVKDLRQETSTTRLDPAKRSEKDDELMVAVQWDNGTISYLAPDALEVVS